MYYSDKYLRDVVVVIKGLVIDYKLYYYCLFVLPRFIRSNNAFRHSCFDSFFAHGMF